VSTPTKELARRREALQALSEAQRNLLGAETREIIDRVSVVDRAYARVRDLATSPVGIVLGGAALLLVGPRRLVRLAGRGLVVFTAARRVANFMRR